MRKLSLDAPVVDQLLSATEFAAIAASEFVGSGDKVAVDAAAVRAMRAAFDQIAVNAVVVVGEGEKDRAPMLFAGERLGTGKDRRSISRSIRWMARGWPPRACRAQSLCFRLQHPEEITKAAEAGMSTERLLEIDDLVSSDGYLFLTAVTSGDTLAGVVRGDDGVITDSWIVDPHRGVLRVTRQHPLL